MNSFRQLLKAAGHQAPLGTWVMSASPLVAEAVGVAGFDWGVLDMEHSPLDVPALVGLLQAVAVTKMVPVVRVPGNDAVTVKRVLDAGAQTLLFPLVHCADEARQAVASTRYPPEGVRGMTGMSRASRFGTRDDHFRHANREIGVIVQLESSRALDELEAIARVPGVDALFVGPPDLAADLGHPGLPMHPRVLEAMADAAQRAATLGKPIGTIGANPQQVAQYRAAGYGFVALASDLGLLVAGAETALAALRHQSAATRVHTLADGTLAE
jgi:2-keto-3-deoxy-L-rhamnonate aldolase RhmA